jgi:hypothetical protein
MTTEDLSTEAFQEVAELLVRHPTGIDRATWRLLHTADHGQSEFFLGK